MSVQTNSQLLRDAAEAFNDPARRSEWFALHHPSVVAHGLAADPLDLDALREFYHGLWSAFPDLAISVEDLVEAGDRVAWRLQVSGTHLAEFRGVPATGRRVSFTAQYLFRFEGGTIVERWTTLDRLGVLVQIGAIAVPA